MNNRGKQFLPFDALKGFQEALKEKEKIYIEKMELLDDEIELINRQLLKLKIGMMVKIKYYDNGNYLEIQGMVSKIDQENQYLVIVKTKIKFNDILFIDY